MDKTNKVALFIDAENIGSEYADKVINTAKSYGELIIKRIYGGSKTKPIADWREKAGEYGILSAIRYVYTAKKNASDISLAVDVMNVLHERDVDVFCIASSDSDFTGLAHELRERGKTVVGMGLKSVNKTYASALSVPYIELDGTPIESKKEESDRKTRETGDDERNRKVFIEEIKREIDALIAEKQTALMSTLGNRINKNERLKATAVYEKSRDGNLTDFLMKMPEIAENYEKKGHKTDTALIRKQNSADKSGAADKDRQEQTQKSANNMKQKQLPQPQPQKQLTQNTNKQKQNGGGANRNGNAKQPQAKKDSAKTNNNGGANDNSAKNGSANNNSAKS